MYNVTRKIYKSLADIINRSLSYYQEMSASHLLFIPQSLETECPVIDQQWQLITQSCVNLLNKKKIQKEYYLSSQDALVNFNLLLTHTLNLTSSLAFKVTPHFCQPRKLIFHLCQGDLKRKTELLTTNMFILLKTANLMSINDTTRYYC